MNLTGIDPHRSIKRKDAMGGGTGVLFGKHRRPIMIKSPGDASTKPTEKDTCGWWCNPSETINKEPKVHFSQVPNIGTTTFIEGSGRRYTSFACH